MGLWATNNSIGAYWTKDGRCFAVLCEGSGDAVRVAGVWSSPPSDSPDVSAALTEALRSFDTDQNTRVLVGGSDQSCAVQDLSLPRLPPQDLRNALLFELRKQCPLPAEQLVWGYRIVPGTVRGTKQTVRLFYLRDNEWGKWVENVSGLTRRVDALMSPRMALDPAFAGQAVRLGPAIRLGPCTDGVRGPAAAEDGEANGLGDGPSPLEIPGLEPGPLAGKTADEQREFVPAIVLAAHGLQGDPAKDRKTMPPFPSELLPKRNQWTKAAAAVLSVYVAAVVLLWAGISLKKAFSHRQALRQRMAEVEGRIATLEEDRMSADVETALEEGVAQVAPDMPRLTEVLSELTDIIPKEFWVSKMSWTAGKVELEIRGEGTDLAFIQGLEDSPILQEVELADKKVDSKGNLRTARIRLLTEGPELAGAAPVGQVE
jgi:Tfp pilus assembly protein PilN